MKDILCFEMSWWKMITSYEYHQNLSVKEWLRKALEITPENLEDLLTYDDLFLDYFNAFLALPVFPQALAYDRLTGAFEEVSSPYNTTASDSMGYVSPSPPLPYGATDTVRENMLQWAREERLPLFMSTQLFRELKLCKLLLRALDDRNSASRGSSRQIRGYSRESESFISSLSISGDNSAEDDLLEDHGNWNDLRELFKYQRPGSKALSDPIKGYLFRNQGQQSLPTTSFESSSKNRSSDRFASGRFDHVRSPTGMVMERERTITGSPSTVKRAARISSQVEVIPSEGLLLEKSEKDRKSFSSKKTKPKPPTSSTEAAFLRGSRVLSAPVNYAEYFKIPFFHFDALLRETPVPTGEPFVTFEDDLVSEAQTETDVRNLEGRLKMTFQQMKEQVIGTYVGMESFKEFLNDTTGVHLLNFWLDCEYFKDSMEDYDEEVFIETRNCLFRDIQDKYKLNLTNDAKEQITRAASNVGLTHTIFLRTQYDVLRRLRAYWIARFLMHFERQKPLSEDEERAMVQFKLKKPEPKNSLPFFPSISLVHSMPVWPEEALNLSRISTWDQVTSRNMNRDIKSARYSRTATSRSTKERLILALSTDKLAGGPFATYLEDNDENNTVSNLLFWQDVREYGASEDKSADRLLRLRHAWSIYNNYISQDSPHNIDVAEADINILYQKLASSQDFIEASVFDTIKDNTIGKLEKAWIRFLKDDLKIFLDRLQPLRIPGSTTSERALRLHHSIKEAEEIDVEKLAEQRKKNKEKRKEAERERKRAVRAAYARRREAKLKKPPSRKKSGVEEGDIVDKVGKLPTFQEMASNKQMIQLFKKYLNEFDSREVSYMIGLYQDVDNYFNSKEGKSRKDNQSNQINKSYFDSQSRKHVPMPDRVMARLSVEKERPRTPTLKDAQKFVLSKIEDSFKEFLNYQGEELGIDQEEMMAMSGAELTMRLGSDAAMLSNWNKRSTKSKGKKAAKEEEEPPLPDAVVRELTIESVNIRMVEAPSASKVKRVQGQAKSDGEITPSDRKNKISKKPTMPTVKEEGKRTLTRESSFHDAPPVVKHRLRRYKQTGRAQPNKNDMADFISYLSQAAFGHLPLEILYFYKYLVKHGEEDGLPLVDRDLFFYIEVQKFKDISHAFSDEEILKRKVQSIVDCFLESVYTPSLQVDIGSDIQQKILKSVQRYMAGKEFNPAIFDDAQMTVFKELLPYWAGFRKSFSEPEDKTKKPMTKLEKTLKKRLDNIQNYQIPSATLKLPPIPEGAVPAFSLSLAEGIKFREIDDGNMLSTPMPDRGRRRLSIAQSIDSRASRRISNHDNKNLLMVSLTEGYLKVLELAMFVTRLC
ncbi:hypothetical protein LOTGIDRAFT_236545 [Lottia gigantea]|uniref:RGS domain-containing protein n=1 Tax=Lottia gigantea TaxID=225164 RepID=V3ZRK6_LOTGI|nr:hypothetical protein LOTGIDRAFT_236545 [Lottia gigantea]ESO83511.1 hypothetical protein LOTGIDRAFT_236545 [Lottia gigantea]